ncbi:MAG: hypothetical protein ACXVBE_07670 [Bdellovibrionota bacterium]
MKTLTMTLVALALITTSAHAREQLPHSKWKGGSQCGLTDDYGSDQWKEIGKSLNLGSTSKVDPSSLPTVMKQQLIITANRGVDTEHVDPVRSAKDAVAVLQESSEAGDLYVSHFEYNGNEFTQVLLYAGGNPNGLIFEKGTVHAVGIISDSDVECVK